MQALSVICAISFVLLTVTFHQGLALKCWRCSSDSRGGEFCSDPFDSEKIAEKELNWAYITCKNPTNRDEVPVCKKTVQNINNKVVVKRSCGVESVRDGAEGECDKFASSPSFVKTVDCSTCRVDGCNGEISTDYGSLAKDFPPEELKHLIKAKEPEVIGEDDVEDDDMSDDDNNIGRDAAERGNLVTKPEHHPTEAVPHAKDPEANAAEQRSVYTAMSLISVALLANYFSH